MHTQPQSALTTRHHQFAGLPLAAVLHNQICCNQNLSCPMEAHDAVSSAIAERAGTEGWRASGLSTACSLGDRDANETSWTELVDVVDRKVGSTVRRVLVDGDSGFDNFNSARILRPSSDSTARLAAHSPDSAPPASSLPSSPSTTWSSSSNVASLPMPKRCI
jgi:phosphoenolpyruvate phosphomutase